jgi:DNA-binding MarR family transcriptional regulator
MRYDARMSPTKGLADSIEMIVMGAVGLTSRALTEAAPEAELTFPQWRALMVVGSAAGGMRVGRVAELVGITSPAAGRSLRRLEQRGLVALDTDAADRRATVARLTRDGEQTRNAIVRYRQRALRSLAEDLPSQERGRLAVAAATIADAFEPFT